LSAAPAGYVPSPRHASPHRVCSLLRVLSNGGAATPVGLSRILHAVCHVVPKYLLAPASRFSHHRPPHTMTVWGSSPLELKLPLRVSPMHHRGIRHRRTRPYQGSFPLQRFSSREEPHTPAETHLVGYVASPGFRTLSTLYSPHDLPSLFHPGPAHGVSLRGLDPTFTPYILPDAGASRA
jgi:hypothetical protein